MCREQRCHCDLRTVTDNPQALDGDPPMGREQRKGMGVDRREISHAGAHRFHAEGVSAGEGDRAGPDPGVGKGHTKTHPT